jgi:hypothetical protein
MMVPVERGNCLMIDVCEKEEEGKEEDIERRRLNSPLWAQHAVRHHAESAIVR